MVELISSANPSAKFCVKIQPVSSDQNSVFGGAGTPSLTDTVRCAAPSITLICDGATGVSSSVSGFVHASISRATSPRVPLSVALVYFEPSSRRSPGCRTRTTPGAQESSTASVTGSPATLPVSSVPTGRARPRRG
jgi:hypothetical protein